MREEVEKREKESHNLREQLLADAQRHDKEQMLRFIAAANRHGVYFHDYGGGACHHGFCAAMSIADTREALDRLDRSLARFAGGGSGCAWPILRRS